METNVYRATITLSFDIDATSMKAAREIANDRSSEWLKNVIDNDGVQDHEIAIARA